MFIHFTSGIHIDTVCFFTEVVRQTVVVYTIINNYNVIYTIYYNTQTAISVYEITKNT